MVPKIRDAGAPPPWDGERLTHRHMLLTTCYHAKFSHSGSNHMGVGGGPPSFGMLGSRLPWNWGVADP